MKEDRFIFSILVSPPEVFSFNLLFVFALIETIIIAVFTKSSIHFPSFKFLEHRLQLILISILLYMICHS